MSQMLTIFPRSKKHVIVTQICHHRANICWDCIENYEMHYSKNSKEMKILQESYPNEFNTS